MYLREEKKLGFHQKYLLVYYLDQYCLTFAPKIASKRRTCVVAEEREKRVEITWISSIRLTRGLCLSNGENRGSTIESK